MPSLRHFIRGTRFVILNHVIALVAAAENYNRDLILGGQSVAPGRFPFFSFIRLGGNNGCGATLIHEDILLTAAHCQTVFDGRGVHVGAETDFGTTAEFHEDERLVQHPDYDPNTFANDIMLVHLQTSSALPPVILNRDPAGPVVGTPLTVIGFGHTQENGSLSPMLQQAQINAADFAPCQALFMTESQVEINDSIQLCAYDATGAGKDACQADSGGPILNFVGEQVGIVSFGLGCGQVGVPAVYTRVSGFADWIDEQVCLLSRNPPANCQTAAPTRTPTVTPTAMPTAMPTMSPTTQPRGIATVTPTVTPTRAPTAADAVFTTTSHGSRASLPLLVFWVVASCTVLV